MSRPCRVPVHSPRGVHDRREDGEKAQRSDEKGIVLVHEEDVEVGVEQGDAGGDKQGKPHTVQYRGRVRPHQCDDRNARQSIGEWETDVLRQ